MFAGNKYYAFVVETYKDIRLVEAPPQSIGKFGSDTDNWVWPRHTGDFSMFRIYADKTTNQRNTLRQCSFYKTFLTDFCKRH